MAVGDKIFLDTDVALDHLADHQPFAECAHRLFALAEKGEITLCLSALSFSNLYYILRKPLPTRPGRANSEDTCTCMSALEIRLNSLIVAP